MKRKEDTNKALRSRERDRIGKLVRTLEWEIRIKRERGYHFYFGILRVKICFVFLVFYDGRLGNLGIWCSFFFVSYVFKFGKFGFGRIRYQALLSTYL
jgi:hypothetical protein